MSINIAGRKVELNDALYHAGYRVWGEVVRFDEGTAVVKLHGADGSTREVYVRDGGYVGDARQVYWHTPLALDVPRKDVSHIQRILDRLVEEYER